MNRIRQLRQEKNMTQLRLSMELEVSQETISAYENGKHYPSAKSLLRLSELFNASIDYIMGVSNTRNAISQNELSIREIEHLYQYRQLSGNQKEKADGFIMGLLQK